MDREMAIGRIKSIKTLYALTHMTNEALDLAVEALLEKHQLSGETSTKWGVSEDGKTSWFAEEVTAPTDLISRAEVLGYIDRVKNSGLGKVKSLEYINKYVERMNTVSATTTDCISRYAVEEMIKAEMPERGMWEIEGDKEKETVCEVCVDLMQKLSELPPVEPPKKVVAQIKVDIDELVERIKEEYEITDRPVCEDAISRKWVLNEIITKVENDDSLTDEQKGSLSVAKYIIRHAPPVTPTDQTIKEIMDFIGGMNMVDEISNEAYTKISVFVDDGTPTERTGEWIESEIPNELYVCSECGGACWSYDYERNIVKSNYCPNCGAKMKGGTENE